MTATEDSPDLEYPLPPRPDSYYTEAEESWPTDTLDELSIVVGIENEMRRAICDLLEYDYYEMPDDVGDPCDQHTVALAARCFSALAAAGIIKPGMFEYDVEAETVVPAGRSFPTEHGGAA